MSLLVASSEHSLLRNVFVIARCSSVALSYEHSIHFYVWLVACRKCYQRHDYCSDLLPIGSKVFVWPFPFRERWNHLTFVHTVDGYIVRPSLLATSKLFVVGIY